jgi:heavy metal sensor kinase
LAAFHHESQELLWAFLLAGPLILLVTLAGGYHLARRTLDPVHRMTETARHISAERLGQRLPVNHPGDELGRLAGTLNDMLDRLERSFTEMQRFTADAAHELRTPLAVIRNEAEVALRQPRSAEDYRQAMTNLLEETVRLGQLADELLFLSRHDAGLYSPILEEVPLDRLLTEVVENMRPLAEEKTIRLTVQADRVCVVKGDAQQLRRVFYNLLDNAIKYTGQGGAVSVAVATDSDRVRVTVSDTGIGIAAEHLPRLFDRFYRVDRARSDNGVGLGLSICQSIIRGAGGEIAVSSTPGQGTVVDVRLPIARSE